MDKVWAENRLKEFPHFTTTFKSLGDGLFWCEEREKVVLIAQWWDKEDIKGYFKRKLSDDEFKAFCREFSKYGVYGVDEVMESAVQDWKHKPKE